MRAPRRHHQAGAASALCCLLLLGAAGPVADVSWQHISSKDGQRPDPGGSNQQTGTLIADLDAMAPWTS